MRKGPLISGVCESFSPPLDASVQRENSTDVGSTRRNEAAVIGVSFKVNGQSRPISQLSSLSPRTHYLEQANSQHHP